MPLSATVPLHAVTAKAGSIHALAPSPAASLRGQRLWWLPWVLVGSAWGAPLVADAGGPSHWADGDIPFSAAAFTELPIGLRLAFEPEQPTASGHDQALQVFRELTVDVLTSGFRTVRVLSKAYENATWVLEHGSDMLARAHDLRTSWQAVKETAARWEDMKAAEAAKNRHPHEDLHDGPSYIELTMMVVLVIAAFATLQKKRSFDLFSPMVYSRAQVSVAFTIVSLVSLTIGNSWRVTSFSDGNPFALYVTQLGVCFSGVFCTLPIVVGVYQGAPKWLVVCSFVFVLWFLSLWLLGPASAVRLFIATGGDGRLPMDCAVTVAVSLLSFVLLLFSARHLALHLCPWSPRFPPFFQVHVELCRGYLRERLRLGTEGSDAQPPAHLPVALCVCILGVGTFMSVLFFSAANWAARDYSVLHDWVIDFIFPLQPFFTWAGHPLPLDDMTFLATRSLVSFFIALFFGVLVTAWILYTVVLGYRRIFRQLARNQTYQGRATVEKYGASVFHATWGTYFAGALMGNCVMASCVVGLVMFSISMVLSLQEFWEVVWASRDWGIFYGLLYITRSIVFRWVIPAYVVSDDGSILRWRSWALVFPTLTLLNFIVGATAGFVRSVVLMPFLLVRFFRVDITFLYEGLEDWDWSYQPFLSVVMHAHARLNPVMWALVSDWACSRVRKESFMRPADENAGEAFMTPMASPVDAESAGFPMSADRPRLVEEGTAPLRGASVRGLRGLEAGGGGAEELSVPRTQSEQRAINRWQLAVLLARNPSLASFRVRGRRPDSAEERSSEEVPGAATEAPISFAAQRPSSRTRMAELVRATTGPPPIHLVRSSTSFTPS